jgi:hypothetical protein
LGPKHVAAGSLSDRPSQFSTMRIGSRFEIAPGEYYADRSVHIFAIFRTWGENINRSQYSNGRCNFRLENETNDR